jgi:hypothetical protein
MFCRGFVAALLVLGTASLASADDTVLFRDRTAKPEKIGTLVGKITTETINGVKLKPTVGAERDIAAADIVDIVYEVPGAVKLTLGGAIKLEQQRGSGDAGRKALQDAVNDYQAVLKGLNEKFANAARHIQFKILNIQAILTTDKLQQLQLADEFDKFRKANANAWQLLPAVRQQAQLLIACDKFDDAARIYDETAKNPNLSKERLQEVELLAVDALMRAEKYTEAEKRIDTAGRTLPPDHPQAVRLKIYQVGCQAKKADMAKVEPMLRDIVEKNADPNLRALAYNTLGDCFFATGQKKDAQWAYLMVDVVYFQDRGEHLKALERLVKVFKDLNDEEYAKKYEEKLARIR